MLRSFALAAGLLGAVLIASAAAGEGVDSHATDMYDERLYDLVETALTDALGPAPNVFHEIISDVVHLDLVPFAPTAERDFWVVSTLGMSFREMSVPAGIPDAWFWKRAELMVALPADWPGFGPDRNIVGGDTFFHPLSILKQTARYPHLADTALAPMHTLEFGEPLGPDTSMTAVLIWWPDFLPDEAVTVVVGPDAVVNLLIVIPIYGIEREYAETYGSEALYELLKAAGANRLYDLGRDPVVSGI
jgi:hypothetical protein